MNQELTRLREAIEDTVGKKILTPKDFDFLAESIYQKLHQRISTSTLKRLWGYVGSEGHTPRRSSLDLLAQFVDTSDWDTFCHQPQTPVAPLPRPKRLWRILALAAPLLLMLAALLPLVLHRTAQPYNPTTVQPPNRPSGHRPILRKGQVFGSFDDYLSVFGIKTDETPHYQPLPQHPHVYIWGPQYHHPQWHNEGDPDRLMPTITEYWTPASTGDAVAIEAIEAYNVERYLTGCRFNEVRITFMKDMVDSSFVFLGIYRLSARLSNRQHLVWERVADQCDLNQLGLLDGLRNPSLAPEQAHMGKSDESAQKKYRKARRTPLNQQMNQFEPLISYLK